MTELQEEKFLHLRSGDTCECHGPSTESQIRAFLEKAAFEQVGDKFECQQGRWEGWKADLSQYGTSDVQAFVFGRV